MPCGIATSARESERELIREPNSIFGSHFGNFTISSEKINSPEKTALEVNIIPAYGIRSYQMVIKSFRGDDLIPSKGLL